MPVNVVPSSEVPVTAEGDTAELGSDWDITKARTTKLESVQTPTARRHNEYINEVKQRYAEEVSVG